MDLKKYRALFFDFDGVLFDSEPIHYRAWKETIQNLGYLDPEFPSLDEALGVSDQTLARDFKKRTLAKEEVLDLCRIKDGLFLEIVGIGGFDSSEERELLESLENRFYLAVVSSSSERVIHYLLDKANLSRFFSLIITGDHVTKHKPDPMPYKLALEKTGFSPQETLAIEDSVAGSQSAQKAGLGVINLRRYPSLPLPPNTLLSCSSIKELKKILSPDS